MFKAGDALLLVVLVAKEYQHDTPICMSTMKLIPCLQAHQHQKTLSNMFVQSMIVKYILTVQACMLSKRIPSMNVNLHPLK